MKLCDRDVYIGKKGTEKQAVESWLVSDGWLREAVV